MTKRPAGAAYPHAAQPADHTWCPVLQRIRDRVDARQEPWGTPHVLSCATEFVARDAVRGMYNARHHTSAGRAQCGDLPMSVQATASKALAGDGWIVTLRIWDRKTGRAEIASRANRGEKLTYNVYRDK